MGIKIETLKTPSFLLKALNSVLLVISVSIFYSKFSSWTQFVGTTIVSGLIYTISLMVIYVIGGTPIQKTFYELMMNSYYTVMFFIAAIINWNNSESGGVAIATGVFVFICFILFAIDIGLTLLNMGMIKAFERSSSPTPNSTTQTATNTSTVVPSQTLSYPTSVSNPTTSYASGPAIMNPVSTVTSTNGPPPI